MRIKIEEEEKIDDIAMKNKSFGVKKPKLKYKRILLKISGEALLGSKKFGIDEPVIRSISEQIKEAVEVGAEIALVVGGGNIFRGVQSSAKLGMDQAAADYVGMLGTVMNCLIIQGVLKSIGVESRVMTAIAINQVAEPYIRLKAITHLQKGLVVIFGAGTGNPFFSTDTAGALRAAEISAEALFMAKNNTDGVYSDDPNKNPEAIRYDNITYDDVIVKDLKVMDTAALSLCKNNNIPIVVFDFGQLGVVKKLLLGETIGTYVGNKV